MSISAAQSVIVSDCHTMKKKIVWLYSGSLLLSAINSIMREHNWQTQETQTTCATTSKSA
ncbi:hypothetical protein [Stenoxybacter acetivorans]|uniref:hypothetical protein n=1 Tax=Stenoxybacter acetivorans TaxID=422441 RepID=UPI0012EBABC1|nr:hypothetical protein [Stenoxybacter acetivorans]